MTLPACQTLRIARDEGVLRVVLDRPAQRNAMNEAMVSELLAVFEHIHGDDSVRAIVLSGAGGHFCAGGDLKEMLARGEQPRMAGEPDPIAGYSRRFGTLMRAVATAPAVVIVIADGSVLGGGLGLACVSDLAFAQFDAKFGVPETRRGLLPAQIAPYLVERIGLTAARRLCLTGAMFDGREALALGLVQALYADAAEGEAKLAETLAQVRACAPQANALTKRLLLAAGQVDREALLDSAARDFAAAVRGEEAGEGLAAFAQKRAPRWQS